MKTGKQILYIIVVAIVVTAIVLGIKYIQYVNLSPLNYVVSKGAKKTVTPGVGDRYEFGDYGFYSNNRAVQFSTGKKGSYNKEVIRWDDGTTTLLSVVFQK